MSGLNNVICTNTNKVTDTSVTFRIRAMLPLYLHLPYCATEGEVTAVTMYEINSWCQKVRAKRACFHVANTATLLRHADLGQELAETEQTVEPETVAGIKKLLSTDDTRRKRDIDIFREAYPVSYYERLTECVTEPAPYSPIVRCDIDVFRCVTMHLPLDVLCVVEGDVPTPGLAHLFSVAMSDQLRAMQYSLVNYQETEVYRTPVVYHFRPSGLDYFISVVHPHGVPLSDTADQRRAILQTLQLASPRPCFRPSAAHMFDTSSTDGYLISPHCRINPQQMKGKRVCLVQGDYTYHHYMQDRFDDNQWGCAYRSLQTVVSWFNMQGYSDIGIPSHRQIQQALCDIGDKPSSFVGSRQWIGSFEVALCLEKLIGVQSKFISGNRGDELGSKGRELAVHFETYGSPVMIGGGVLAHTILGVDFNQDTGSTRFLILDPHYTGSEDIKTIIDKGWCGWKTEKFWDQNAMYNMCLPLPTDCV